MSAFDPLLAEIRFGYGLSPTLPVPITVPQVLDGLTGPDDMAARFPIPSFAALQRRLLDEQAATKQQRRLRGTENEEAARQIRVGIKRATREAWQVWIGQTILRRAHTQSAFRERIVAFWADHFTATGKRGILQRGTTPYTDDAIRPFVTLRFADLLQSAVMHPLMLHYLDQGSSIGPNSARAQRAGSNRRLGLNENLAREVLELHTLGVDGPYTQADVTELAELFTGMTYQARAGFVFRTDFVEPGSESVLGQTYADAASAAPARAVLSDLASHPATARHISRKLAVHFTNDKPERSLVDALEATFLATDGSLMALYETLLTHPASWAPELVNFKPPIDFVSSAFRAFAPPSEVIEKVTAAEIKRRIMRPLAMMGQPWEKPIGPDGWSENDRDWITPQGLAARVTWAMNMPEILVDALPDPRQFVNVALGPYANDAVRFAANAAESKAEAIGLVLMSPAFQRR